MKIFCKFERNPCFPEFRTIRLELEMQVFNENEILFCSKTNPCGSFPEFRTVRGGLRKGEAVFRHFVMKLSEPKVLQVNFSVRGRAKPSRNLSCSQFSLRWGPSKILLPLSGGCGSRLSICQAQVNASKRQNKYWDGNAGLEVTDLKRGDLGITMQHGWPLANGQMVGDNA